MIGAGVDMVKWNLYSFEISFLKFRSQSNQSTLFVNGGFYVTKFVTIYRY